MKIERINDNQIRCTLTREDLSRRNIRLSELAYGSAQARSLFQDMMNEAHIEVGFDTDNCPLMIEAIPTSSGSITLVITKVDDPEELDSRFSRFTQAAEDSDSEDRMPFEGADEILDLFNKIYESRQRSASGTAGDKKPNLSLSQVPSEDKSGKGGKTSAASGIAECFRFTSLDEVIQAARGLHHFYTGRNTLYRHSGKYYLILHQSGAAAAHFNKVCNILSEYGEGSICQPASEAFLQEHADVLIRNQAIQKLETLTE